MAKLVWTDEALRWLEDIFEYIAQDNPPAAARTVQGIYDRAQALVQHPEMGERYAGSERHVRILLYDHYRIAYLVKPERVEVLGVFHGALKVPQPRALLTARFSRGLSSMPMQWNRSKCWRKPASHRRRLERSYGPSSSRSRVQRTRGVDELRAEVHRSVGGVVRQMYLAMLGQMAVLLGFAYFFVA